MNGVYSYDAGEILPRGRAWSLRTELLRPPDGEPEWLCKGVIGLLVVAGNGISLEQVGKVVRVGRVVQQRFRRKISSRVRRSVWIPS